MGEEYDCIRTVFPGFKCRDNDEIVNKIPPNSLGLARCLKKNERFRRRAPKNPGKKRALDLRASLRCRRRSLRAAESSMGEVEFDVMSAVNLLGALGHANP